LKLGESEAKEIIVQAARYLAITMRTIMRMFSPQSFLFIVCSDRVANALKEEVERLMNEPDAFEPVPPLILATKYDPFAAPKGASDIVIDKYFH